MMEYGIFIQELKLETNLMLTFYMQLILMQKQWGMLLSFNKIFNKPVLK